jgi:hypothetical protein
MPWVTMPQIRGKVYIPEKSGITLAKNQCPDCFSCQQCSKERCNACRDREEENGRLED